MIVPARRIESPYADWTWNAWRPLTIEDDYEVTEIEGEVPRELAGTYYRTGPSQSPPYPAEGYEALHMFDGDGLVHAFRIEEGRVHYRDRFVRNASFTAEKNAGRPNQDWVGVSVEEPDPSILMRPQPNTNIVWHAGRLLAMVENALPFELDPRTLEPLGEHTCGGRLIARG